MILINKINASEYGIVYRTENYSFTGFSKNIKKNNKDSKIDIYLNNQKINTISSNNSNEHLEVIYDLNESNLCFDYSLEDKYVEEELTIGFKFSESNVELENSPIKIVNPSFKGYLFDNSLHQTIEKNKIKDLYNKNTIGFFATEEKLQNENFINFIKTLHKELPETRFKGFYVDDKQKTEIKKIFSKEIDRIDLHSPSNLYDVAKEIEILIDIDTKLSPLIVKGILSYNKNILLILFPFTEEFTNKKLKELPSMDNDNKIVLEKLGASDDFIKKTKEPFLVAVWENFFIKNPLEKEFTYDISIEEYLLKIIELSLKQSSYKNYLININFLYYKINEL